MASDPHIGFVVAAYLLTAVTVLGLILWTVLDYRAQRRAVAALESSRLSRRSNGR